MMSAELEVAAEVSIQQELRQGGAPAVLTEFNTFAEGSVAISWRGDGAFVATVSQADDECAVPAVYGEMC
jgi:hypothetical protein